MILLRLKSHKLYKIPPKSHFYFKYCGPFLEKYSMKTLRDFHVESSQTKSVNHATDSATLVSKTQTLWEAASPESSALTRKVCFAATFSQEKTTVNTPWEGATFT